MVTIGHWLIRSRWPTSVCELEEQTRPAALMKGRITMNVFKSLALVTVAAVCMFAAAPRTQAQVSVDVNVGAAPDCPYGYYDYAPYACAPYGYYGPEWFSGGVFIGAGPWFHGPDNFQGHVDNRYDVQRGYKGPAPKVGDKPEADKRPDQAKDFKGNEVRDGRGHVVNNKH
jgi:hypothetical protein